MQIKYSDVCTNNNVIKDIINSFGFEYSEDLEIVKYGYFKCKYKNVLLDISIERDKNYHGNQYFKIRINNLVNAGEIKTPLNQDIIIKKYLKKIDKLIIKATEIKNKWDKDIILRKKIANILKDCSDITFDWSTKKIYIECKKYITFTINVTNYDMKTLEKSIKDHEIIYFEKEIEVKYLQAKIDELIKNESGV